MREKFDYSCFYWRLQEMSKFLEEVVQKKYELCTSTRGWLNTLFREKPYESIAHNFNNPFAFGL